MSVSWIFRLVQLILLLVLQVFLFNHVQIMGYGIPVVYVYMLLLFPLNMSRGAALLWGFAAGVAVDTCSNTPGLGAAACTLMAMMQHPLLKLVAEKDFLENETYPTPSASNIGWFPFIGYTFLLVLAWHIAFFLLEAFNLFNPIETLINIGSGTLSTTLFIMAFESIRVGASRKK